MKRKYIIYQLPSDGIKIYLTEKVSSIPYSSSATGVWEPQQKSARRFGSYKEAKAKLKEFNLAQYYLDTVKIVAIHTKVERLAEALLKVKRYLGDKDSDFEIRIMNAEHVIDTTLGSTNEKL